MRIALLTATLVAVLARPASANIVNVLGSLAGEPEEGWSGSLTGTIDWRTGNVDLAQVGGSGTVRYRAGHYLGLLLLRGEYGKGEGTLLSEKTFAHLRGRVDLDDCRRWLWEAFVQHEFDAFRRLEARAVAGTGPAVRLVDEPSTNLVVGLAYMLEYERFDDREPADAGLREWNHRASSYATGMYKLDDRVAVTQTVYVQPRLDNPSDLWLLSETTLTTQLGKRLALQSSFVVAYDRSPPIGIETTDTALKTGLTLSL